MSPLVAALCDHVEWQVDLATRGARGELPLWLAGIALVGVMGSQEDGRVGDVLREAVQGYGQRAGMGNRTRSAPGIRMGILGAMQT